MLLVRLRLLRLSTTCILASLTRCTSTHVNHTAIKLAKQTHTYLLSKSANFICLYFRCHDSSKSAKIIGIFPKPHFIPKLHVMGLLDGGRKIGDVFDFATKLKCSALWRGRGALRWVGIVWRLSGAQYIVIYILLTRISLYVHLPFLPATFLLAGP